jgi:hypothetical protein
MPNDGRSWIADLLAEACGMHEPCECRAPAGTASTRSPPEDCGAALPPRGLVSSVCGAVAKV